MHFSASCNQQSFERERLRPCSLETEEIVKSEIRENDHEEQPEETDQSDSPRLVKYAYFFSLLSSVCVTHVFLVAMEYKTVAAGSLLMKRSDFAAKLLLGFCVVPDITDGQAYILPYGNYVLVIKDRDAR